MNQTSTSTSVPSHFAIQVVPGGNQHFIGERRAIKRMMKGGGVAVRLLYNTDLIICVNALDSFYTYGPIGGSPAIYQLIEWAFFNTPAFGIRIEQGDDMNIPVLTLPNDKTAEAAVAYLMSKGEGA